MNTEERWVKKNPIPLTPISTVFQLSNLWPVIKKQSQQGSLSPFITVCHGTMFRMRMLKIANSLIHPYLHHLLQHQWTEKEKKNELASECSARTWMPL